MIELTEQQRQQLLASDIPHLLDPDTGKTYVLLETEVYERERFRLRITTQAFAVE
jgi:hypothetical protein